MNEIEQKLVSLGMTEEQASQAIKDVEGIISKKILSYYLTKLSPEELSQIESLSEGEIPHYLGQNKSKLGQLTKEDVERITSETWGDYFASVGE
ncbi:MAG: hypothetical protein QG579_197 [Patescibacteria group bacterium]|jgi:hypothetical protein|nr:hypothetical protein [Patescibacteria group bacterium]